MPNPIAAGFWSYVHFDDEHEKGRITRLRERLERSIQFHSGIRDFRIFQDRNDIGWGERWAERLAESLGDALLLFPVVTPSYFSSGACRDEALAFRQRQKKLSRNDLILPIYYLRADPMEDAEAASGPEPRSQGSSPRTSTRTGGPCGRRRKPIRATAGPSSGSPKGQSRP